MSFSVDIVQKRLVSPVDILEEIELKKAKGYQFIGAIKRRESITEEQWWGDVLTGPSEVAFSSTQGDIWHPMRKMMNRLASYEDLVCPNNVSCNHFHITMTSEGEGVMGWVFALIDKRVDHLDPQFQHQQQKLLGEWRVIWLWLQQSWKMIDGAYIVMNRSGINRLIHDYHGRNHLPPRQYSALLPVYPFTGQYGDFAVRHNDTHTLVGILQINTWSGMTGFMAEELVRLINAFSAEVSCRLVRGKQNGLHGSYDGDDHIVRTMRLNVDYIQLYRRVSYKSDDVVNRLNTFFSRMRESLALDWLLRSRFMKIGMTNSNTLAMIKDQDLGQLCPNIIDNNGKIVGELDLGVNTLQENQLGDRYDMDSAVHQPRPYTENVLTKSQKKDIQSVLTFR